MIKWLNERENDEWKSKFELAFAVVCCRLPILFICVEVILKTVHRHPHRLNQKILVKRKLHALYYVRKCLWRDWWTQVPLLANQSVPFRILEELGTGWVNVIFHITRGAQQEQLPRDVIGQAQIVVQNRFKIFFNTLINW